MFLAALPSDPSAPGVEDDFAIGLITALFIEPITDFPALVLATRPKATAVLAPVNTLPAVIPLSPLSYSDARNPLALPEGLFAWSVASAIDLCVKSYF